MYFCTHLAAPTYLQSLRGVIFDCDGVMVDSMDANRMYYNLIRQKLGLLSMTPEEEEYVHTHAVTECIKRIIPAERYDEAEQARSELDYREVLPFLKLEPGLVDFLTMLKRKGLFIGIYTNRTTTMELLLEVFDLRHFFSPVITAGKVSHPKPNPEGIHKALRMWGVAPGQVAYLGDSYLDERTARAAGVPFWAYKNTALLASMHVDDFEALRQCLSGVLPDSGL